MLDFGHDSGLESIVTAMQLLPAKYDGSVTVNDIDANRAWQSALIAPMGGRLEVERLQCTGGKFSGKYIRFVLNNAVVPLEPLAACKSDKNAAAVGICKLDTFIGTQSKALSGADFANICCALDLQTTLASPSSILSRSTC